MSVATETYARAESGPGLRVKARRGRGPLTVVIVFVLVVAVIIATRAQENTTPLSTLNAGPSGTRALAEVARAQGVTLREVDRLGRARITDPASTTLVIADGGFLQSFQVRSILDYPGDVVVLGDANPFFDTADYELADLWSEESVLQAKCADRHAQAAGSITSSGMVISGTLPAEAVGCFPGPGDSEWAMVTATHNGHSLVFISELTVVYNRTIAEEGNAALALRSIGAHENVVWYVGGGFDSSTLTWTQPGSPGDPGAPGEPGGGSSGPPDAAPDFLPPGTGNFLYGLGLALAVVVLWRARRFGALVTEPLPVVIRSSEATRGRARLYRAARAHGRAGAALRAAAATRLGKRLGVSRHDTREALIAAVTRASGQPSEKIAELLFGPPPESESAMMDLAQALDQLEREVHRT